MTLKEKAKVLKQFLPALFLAMKRKDTPLAAKIVAGVAVGYALSPIDLIPDFVPVLGYLDDLIILPMLVALAIKLIPMEIMEACRVEADEVWKNGRPKNWYYAIPIILIWIVIAGVILVKLLD